MNRKVFLPLIFGLLLSFPAAAQWSVALQSGANANGDLNAVYFDDSKRGWVAGDGGFLAWTEDGGKSWVKLKIGTKEAITDVYFRGEDKGYLIAGEKVFSSTDGGLTWREEKILLASDIAEGKPELSSLRFANKKNGWIVGLVNKDERVVDSLVLHSSDGGTIWRRVRVPTKEELIHLDFIDEERGWIVGAAGTILRTTDGGVTWKKILNTGTDAVLYHVDFKNENLGWAVGEKGLILRTTDGGATWRKIPSGLTRHLLSVEFVNEKDGWIVGRGGNILRSSDGGLTWVRQESGTTENLFALYVDKKNGWAVGGKGIILRYER